MKKAITFPFLLFCWLAASQMLGQTASNICLDELKESWKSVDQSLLMQSDQITTLAYDIAYTVTSDPEKTLIKGHEEWLLTRNRLHHLTDDMETYSDDQHAFFYRPHQFMVYLAPSAFKEEKVFQSIDAGFWSFCTVVHCGYISEGAYEWNGQMVTPKEYTLEINPQGQQKYKITQAKVITDPVFKKLISIDLTYQGKMLYSTAKYTLTTLQTQTPSELPLPSLDDQFLEGPGQLKSPYTGCKLQDIR